MRGCTVKMFSLNAVKVTLLAAVVLIPLYAAGESFLVRFEGGIGVIPVSAGPAANVVRGINPGGQPWVIAGLSADIEADGRISVDGRGLLLAGGNNIGTNGGQSVVATLFCNPATQTPTTHSTSPGVPLEPNGDFRIEDLLDPAPPAVCANPVLLIRSSNNGNWFAAGILKD